MPNPERKKFLKKLNEDQLQFLIHHWPFWARQDQLPPSGNWLTWLILGGRGAGKTRAGAEWIKSQVEGATPLATGRSRHIALIGETLLAVREVMIEGPSGLNRITASGWRPEFIASRQLLIWPNGAQAQIFSAHNPEKLRGPQFDAAWCDELCKWRNDETCWDMLQFGLRLGQRPRQVVTTTPRPTALLKKLVKDPTCHVTRVSTFANESNLAPGFIDTLLARYATAIGRVVTALPAQQQWKLGVSADDGRYGTQIGGAEGSTNIGVSSSPQAYYGQTPVRITAQSGTLSSGQIRLKLFLFRLTLPAA